MMLSSDQIQRELRAIEDLDAVFLAASKYYPEEVPGGTKDLAQSPR